MQYTNPDMLVFLSASAIEGLMGLRANDWSPPVVERSSFCRGFNRPVLRNLTSQGMLALKIFEGSVNEYHFDRFSHEGIVHSVLAPNMRTANLPPAYYLPDFKPIYEVFSFINARLQDYSYAE